MQLKVKDMQLKVSMQKNIGGKRIKGGYMFTLFFSLCVTTLSAVTVAITVVCSRRLLPTVAVVV